MKNINLGVAIKIGCAAGLTAMALWCGGADTTSPNDGWRNFSAERKTPQPTKLLWNHGFDVPFTVEFKCGAEGKYELVDSKINSGRKALKITKSNQLGYIVVKSSETITAKNKQQLQACVNVTSENSSPDYSIGMLRLVGKSGSLEFDGRIEGAGNGGDKMFFITNTLPGVFERKLCHFLADDKAGLTVTPAIVVGGAPSTSVWDNWYVEDYKEANKAWKKAINAAPKPDRHKQMISDDELTQRLTSDVQHTAKVKKVNGFATLFVDGKAVPPVVFKGYPYSSLNKCEYAGGKAEKGGIKLQCVALRFGHSHRMEGLWKGKHDFDAKTAVKIIRDAMKVCPDSVFLITVITDPYEDFCKDYPEEGWIQEDGKIVYGHFVHAVYFLEDTIPMGPDGKPRYWQWASMSSKVWRDGVKENLAKLHTELKKDGMDKRIVGLHIAGFHDHQFATRKLDYSKPAIAAFHEFLKKKYGTVEALRKAWCDKKVTFETAKAPKFYRGYYLNPKKDMACIDFLRCQKEAPFRSQEDIARYAKKLFGKDIIALRWCMANFSGDFGGAYDITAFTESDAIDVLVAQPAYTTRLPGLSTALRGPFASFHNNGKLFLNEFDLRTWGGLHTGETEMRVTWASNALDAPMWRSINHKLAGQMMAMDMGYWYYDMAPNWFEPQPIADDINEVFANVKQVENENRRLWRPDVAFVIDEEGMLLRNLGYNYYNFDENNLVAKQCALLSSSGVQYDMWLLNDFLKNPNLAEKYKMLVFAGINNFDEKRTSLINSLKGKMRTLVFLSGTGNISGAKKVLGMSYELKKKPAHHETMPAPRWEQVNVISAQAQELMLRYLESKVNSHYLPQRFSIVADKSVQPIALYADDKAFAIGMTESGNYRVVSVAEAGGLTPELFNKLAVMSNCYVTANPGIQINMNGRFLSVHGLRFGKYEFKLPFAATVLNRKNGVKVADNTKSFTIDVEPGTTYWFDLVEKRR